MSYFLKNNLIALIILEKNLSINFKDFFFSIVRLSKIYTYCNKFNYRIDGTRDAEQVD